MSLHRLPQHYPRRIGRCQLERRYCAVNRFQYFKAESVRHATELKATDEDALFLAGGMSLLPTIKLHLAEPSSLIDLNGIDGLAEVTVEDDAVVLGAMCRHADVAANPLVQDALPVIAHLADGIGDPQVRNRGTLGGSLANNDPAADYPAALLALDAIVATDRREIAAQAFIRGLFDTALEADELINSVRFRRPSAAAYMKFPNPASRFALVGVMVATFDETVRVAVTGAGECAFRANAMESRLADSFCAEALADYCHPTTALSSDLHASAAYRAHLITVMAQRAVAAITESV